MGLGLMFMHGMTSENKYALARQVEAEPIDPYLIKFILASDAILLSRDGHHILSIVKHIVPVPSMHEPSEDRADIGGVPWSVCLSTPPRKC